MDEPDAVLMERIAAGDERAFERLYARHAQSLLSYAQRTVGERAPAEEALQDTFVAVWRSASAYEGRSAVRTWLFGICRRQALKRLRVTVPEPVGYVADRASADPEPDEIVLARADAAAVGVALRALPAGHRDVLNLAFGAGLPQAEIAEVLGIPVGTVKSRLFNARAALATALATERSPR